MIGLKRVLRAVVPVVLARVTLTLLPVCIASAYCCRADTYVPPPGAIQSLYVRDSDVFASTREGIYRALKSDKQWEKLSIPECMPTGGRFATGPRSAEIILYTGVRYIDGGVPDADKKVFGLYCSEDSGRHWDLITKDHDFGSVYLHPDGAIYAAEWQKLKVTPGESTNGKMMSDANDGSPPVAIRNHVLVSEDKGKSWRDITGTMPTAAMICSIFADPDHPDLVCVSACVLRGYVFQATDKSYNWESEREWDWHARHETDDTFFGRYYGTQKTLYMLQPTLSNYFTKGAPDAAQSCPFDIVPDKLTYHFRASQPKTIRVSVRFIAEGHKIILPDFRGGTDLWSVKVIGPDGKRTATRAVAVQAIYKAKDRPAETAKLRRDSRFSTYVVYEGHPYTRSIDLGKLFHFSTPGQYRVQLAYDNTWIANQLRGQWPGNFAGQVFTVVIK